MYLGVLVLAASVLLWLGAALLRKIEWILPWSAGVGIALILVSMAMELRKSAQTKSSTAAVEQPTEPAGTGTQAEGDAR
ncbi:hypothetical protein HRbin15_01853 [bacterium HR15]|nr:hypothetical protein HRbin15_01853 [bacterium HR15]